MVQCPGFPTSDTVIPVYTYSQYPITLSKVFSFGKKKLNSSGGSGSEESACNAEDLGSVPESGRSPGKGNDYPLQYSCLENSMDRGAWWATVYWVARVAKVGHDYTNTSTFLLLLIIKSEMKIIRWSIKRKLKTRSLSKEVKEIRLKLIALCFLLLIFLAHITQNFILF